MGFKTRDEVYWVITPRKDRKIERAGIVVAVVPAFEHPNSVGVGKIVHDNVHIRSEESYIVQIPNTQSFFWLSGKTISILPEDKKHLLQTQVRAQEKPLAVDKHDRLKIKQLCKTMGWDFSESKDFIHIDSIKKRFVFRVMGGVEFIWRIEQIRL